MLRIDPGSGAFLVPGSGIRDGKKDRRSAINITDLVFEYLVSVFRLKCLNSLMRIRIRDPGSWVNPGLGIRDGKSQIRDQG